MADTDAWQTVRLSEEEDSDEKNSNDNNSRGSLPLQTIVENRSDDRDLGDILKKGMSFRLGMPRMRTSVVEDVNLVQTGNDLDSKDYERAESSSFGRIHPDLLNSCIDEKQRSESQHSIPSVHRGISQRDKIQVIFTPKRKSIQITEAISWDKRRISLRLTEKLILKQSDPKDHYDISQEVLGTGTFGTVRGAVNKLTKKEVAIKRIKKKKLDEGNRALLENEIRILRQIKHESIVCLFDVCETNKYICLIMELCSGGDVFDWVDAEEHLDEARASGVIQQIATAVDYLHGRGVVHRDLKLENILIVNQKGISKRTPAVVKIADFGFATTIKTQNSLIEGTCGSLNYVAPEVLTRRPYTKACDLWSIGVILYAMLAGYLPFYEEDIGGRSKTFRKIQQGIYDFDDPVWRGVSDLAKSVIKGLLTVKVAARLKCNQLANHQWIRSCSESAKRLTI